MAFWNRNKKTPQVTRKTWYTPGGDVQRLSEMVFDAEHTLIAGTTGCGKSTLLHGIIGDLLRLYAPCEVKLALIDLKLVELSRYSGLPHTMAYADTDERAVAVLRQVEVEMMRRYQVMRSNDLDKWNGTKIFVVIDELAPLMIKASRKDALPVLQNILQLGRAAGIRVIACTQAPNRKVIPAELVLNFSMRIGMRCLSPIESRQIVGQSGCEALPLHGKALVVYGCEVLSARIPNTDRADIADLVDYWQSDAAYSAA